MPVSFYEAGFFLWYHIAPYKTLIFVKMILLCCYFPALLLSYNELG